MLGWIGWDWDKVNATDVNVLVWALDGRIEMLKQIFGAAEDAQPQRKPMTSERFRAFAADHNRRYEAAARPKRRRRGN